MLLVLLLLTEPLSLVPTSGPGGGDPGLGGRPVRHQRPARAVARHEPARGAVVDPHDAGVLLLGVLPGVVLAVVLSLAWLLALASRPNDAVLGRCAGT